MTLKEPTIVVISVEELMKLPPHESYSDSDPFEIVYCTICCRKLMLPRYITRHRLKYGDTICRDCCSTYATMKKYSKGVQP